MRKYLDALILALVLGSTAVMAILGMKPPLGPSGHVLSAEPRPWFGTTSPSQAKGLSLFGIAVGASVKDLKTRVTPDFSLEEVPGGRNVYALRGRKLDLGIFTQGDTIQQLVAYDLGAVYMDGQPLARAGTVKIGTTLDKLPLSKRAQVHLDGFGTGIDVVEYRWAEDEVDFLSLGGGFSTVEVTPSGEEGQQVID